MSKIVIEITESTAKISVDVENIEIKTEDKEHAKGVITDKMRYILKEEGNFTDTQIDSMTFEEARKKIGVIKSK